VRVGNIRVREGNV